RYCSIVDAHEAIFDGYHPGRHVADQLRHKKWIKTRVAIVGYIFLYLFFKGLHATLSASPDHPNVQRVHLRSTDARIIYRLLCCYQRILGEKIGLAQIILIEMISRVEIFYLAGKLRAEGVRIKPRDARSTTLTGQQ